MLGPLITMVIKGFRVGPLVKKTASEIGADRVTTLAASAAYNFFFSIFPLLLFLAPLLSLAGDKQRMVNFLAGQLTSVLPAEQVGPIHDLLIKIVFAKNAPGILSAGLVLAAWSGSNIFGTLMGALNQAYDVTETRSWVKQQWLRLVSFVLGGIIMIASTVVFLDGEDVATWLGGLLHLGSVVIFVWKIVQFPIAFSGLVLLAYMTYVLLPNVNQHKGQALFASVVTTVLWIIATLLFRIYVNHFPPNPAYGLIGGVIILLTWMYYTMLVVLVGGELASELHHGTGAVAPDKGAVYLGRVVTGAGPESTSVERD